MSLHQRIADLRAAGLTLAEIGKHVRLSAATVNYHLQKRRGLPEGRGKNSHGEPPTPAEITAELAEIRGADLDRLAAQPVRSKTARAKVEARAARKRALHPLISEAVLAATGAEAAESWDEED